MSNSRSQLDRDEESEDGNAVETEESVEKETEEEDLCSLEDFSPLWPSESMGQEQATLLSPEAAMECLEQLKESGEITEDFTIHLKAKYTLLYQAHITQQEKEQEALLRAKQSMAQLEHLRGQLQDSECIPDDPMTERGHLRQVLLDHYNELAKTSQRHEHLLYTLESLQDEKQLVEKEYKKLPKPTEREKQNLVLSEGCEVLKSEVAQRKEEVCILHEELKAQYDEQHKLDLQLEEQQQMENQLKERLATLILQPLQIQNDLELLNIKLKTLKGHQSKLMEQEHTVQAELQQAITLQRIVEQERAQISGEIDQQCTLLMHLGQNRLSLTHKTESATEKCAALQADRKLNQAKKRQHELLITHDGLRTKLFIMKMHLGDLQERHERQKQHLMCLSTASNRAESELPKLRKVYTAAVSQRDKINQMLIQRDQEMSSLAEHVTLQQDLVRRADIELLSLDEKQHLLTLSRVEKCRQLHRLHALRPAYWSMRSQVALLQIEVGFVKLPADIFKCNCPTHGCE
uniref:Coiled-coil domain containing 146 n=1 Tax=Eptatretus burgeri TaxID=7764 RepID=A0A8C4NCJ3_EPTBU